MVSQLMLVGAEYFESPETEEIEDNKRVRYEIPTYIKFYSLYQYDRDKFTKLLKIWLDTEEGKNRTIETLKAKQDEILELCYIRDERGNPLKDSDERHIYRIKTLAKIYRAIYNQIGVNPFNNDYVQDGLRIVREIYTDEEYEYRGKIYKGQKFVNESASICGTDGWTIKKRIIIHLRLLRLLRKGLSIKEALWQLNLTKETTVNTMTETKI